MNCLGCGAAMQAVSNRKYFHCVHCGQYHFPAETDEGVIALGEASVKPCPVCKKRLEKASLEGEEIRYCTHCRGFLARIDSFGRIVNKRRAQHGAHEQILEPFDPAELHRVILCPACDRKMEAHPYFGGGNAVVDTCGHCGWIWLDAGELAIIERYIPHIPNREPVAPDLTEESLPDTL